MVKYSRLPIKKINSSFVIESFIQKIKVRREEKIRLIDYIDLGFYFVVPLLVGLGLGIVIDSKFGTKPVFILLGLAFGFFGSFFNLYKIVQQFSQHASH